MLSSYGSYHHIILRTDTVVVLVKMYLEIKPCLKLWNVAVIMAWDKSQQFCVGALRNLLLYAMEDNTNIIQI